jgi:acyl-coenzyme A synthetase/AMP-(fatty) acid ligase
VPEKPADERQPVPIGTACGGEKLLVLDEAMQPVPAGEAGDLYIGGVGLSPGYWRDPEKTQAAFRKDPFSDDPSERIYRTGDLAKTGPDGLVYFLGRADTQVKSRGYRVELGEVEAALSTIDDIIESAVVAVPSAGFEGVIICCAYVPRRNAGMTSAGLRDMLRASLPIYMVPGKWAEYPALPKNGSGKVDRVALRNKFAGGDGGPIHPAVPAERRA